MSFPSEKKSTQLELSVFVNEYVIFSFLTIFVFVNENRTAKIILNISANVNNIVKTLETAKRPACHVTFIPYTDIIIIIIIIKCTFI